MAEKQEKEEQKDKKIESYGQVLLGEDEHNGKIQLMTIIGEIEGHDVLPAASKTTKYEHILPQLASIEDSAKIGGVLFLINTVGGDVSAGLALAEMIASMKTPSVSLVLGVTQYRSAACSQHRLFLYCADGNDDCPSGAHERNDYRCAADIRLFSADSGQNCAFYSRTFTCRKGKTGTDEDKYRNAYQGFRNHSGRERSGPAGVD